MNLEELPARLRTKLADRVLGHSYASLDTINEFFCKEIHPVIIHIPLLTEDLHQIPEMLNKLLEFWQN